MSVDLNTFREALSHWASGVAIVTGCDGDRPVGLTVSAFLSLSAQPPLVLVSIDRRSRSLAALLRSRRFAVNILAEEHEALSRCFAVGHVSERFAGEFWQTAATGSPVLALALTWLDCEMVDQHLGGDHMILIGLVQLASTPPIERRPLLYYRRAYRQLSAPEEELDAACVTVGADAVGRDRVALLRP